MAINSVNVYESLLPIFVCSKIFGLCPFSLSCNGYVKSYAAVIFPVFIMLLFTCHTISELYMRDDDETLLIYILADTLHTYAGVLCSIAIYTLSIVFGDKMIMVLKTIHSLDQQMQRAYPEFDYTKTLFITKIGCISSCLLVSAIAIILYTIDIICFPPDNVSFYDLNGIVTYCTPFVICNMMILQFSSLLMVLKQRFRWINEQLNRLKDTWNKASRVPGRVYDIAGVTKIINRQSSKCDVILTIEDLRKKHSTIHALCEDVNNMYTFQMLLTTSHNFIAIIMYLMSIIRRNSENFQLLYQVYSVLVIVTCSAQLIVICYVSDWIRIEAKQAALILHTFKNISEEIEIYIRNFSLQLLHSEVIITACYMFRIDKQLLFVIIGGITSYLVLLIQLEISSY